MAARKVAHPSADDRRAKGLEARDRAPSITDFAERYADQNEQDYEEFVKAIQSGRLEARPGV